MSTASQIRDTVLASKPTGWLAGMGEGGCMQPTRVLVSLWGESSLLRAGGKGLAVDYGFLSFGILKVFFSSSGLSSQAAPAFDSHNEVARVEQKALYTVGIELV